MGCGDVGGLATCIKSDVRSKLCGWVTFVAEPGVFGQGTTSLYDGMDMV